MVSIRSKAKFTRGEEMPKPPQALVRSLALSDAVMVVEWLNAARGTATQRRVLEIRRDLGVLGAALESLHQRSQKFPSPAAARSKPLTAQELDYQEDCDKFRERHNELNRILKAYPLCPVMGYNIELGLWRYNAVPRAKIGREIEVTLKGVKVRVNAISVVAAMTRLAANRELHKIRLCEQCQKNWRVSEREMDRYCSQPCREAAYQSRPGYAEKRRNIQRRWRENNPDSTKKPRP
jgi:hypothetical protein